MAKSILASLAGLGGDHAVMETAVAAARALGGHVTCLHARIDAVETAAMIEVTFPQHRLDGQLLRRIGEEEAERGRHARAAFDETVSHHDLALAENPGGDAPVTVSWQETKSFFNETLEEARHHDLVVMTNYDELSSSLIKQVLMQSGRPLL